MASQTGNKESVIFLWTIVPLAAVLTLLFVRWNHNITQPKEMLTGDRPAQVVEMPAAPVAPVADSLAAPADSLSAAPAAPAAP
ncbi:MAG: hypothetical protein ACK5XV_12430 [Flavobacteriales bacterium]|jgi:hypothetical protein